MHCGECILTERGAGSCRAQIGAQNASWCQRCQALLLGSKEAARGFSIPLTTIQKLDGEQVGGREGVGRPHNAFSFSMDAWEMLAT